MWQACEAVARWWDYCTGKARTACRWPQRTTRRCLNRVPSRYKRLWRLHARASQAAVVVQSSAEPRNPQQRHSRCKRIAAAILARRSARAEEAAGVEDKVKALSQVRALSKLCACAATRDRHHHEGISRRMIRYCISERTQSNV